MVTDEWRSLCRTPTHLPDTCRPPKDASRFYELLVLLVVGYVTNMPSLQVFMDDLTDIDDTIGQLKVAVLVPTCGEKVSVMLKALFGNLQLR